ncbi:Nonribosomal peptide synthetase fmqA [Colletotrichum tropicale]|nr:Nonribosomal peptide synthetase fmqA [Colletotrichum tropicale]
MSLPQLDPDVLDELAEARLFHTEAIEDVCKCTALQMGTMTESMMHPNRYKHTAVFSISPSADRKRLAFALAKLVSLTPILRSRIVDSSRRGLVRVVLREEHQIKYFSQPLDEFLEDEKNHTMGLGTPLLRSAFVDGKLVLTTHHAIRDETSTALMLADIVRIYNYQEPAQHIPFNNFVAFCHSIADHEARAFWADRLRGESAIFPTPTASAAPATEPFQRQRHDLFVPGNIIRAQLPAYIEVAWALTATAYTNARAVSFGLVFSGRTPAFASTIGPTAAVVPVRVEAYEVDAQFILSLNCVLHDAKVAIEADFNPVALQTAQMQRILRQFAYTLSWLLSNPMETMVESLLPLNPHDLSEIMVWNQDVPEAVNECIHKLFETRAREQPSAPAVIAPDGTATYGELDDMSTRLALHLRVHGVGPEIKVPLLFGKTIWAVVSFLAVMKAGGACVPLDPSHPSQRTMDIINRCRSCLVLTSSSTAWAINDMPQPLKHFTVSSELIAALPSNGTSLPKEKEASPSNAVYVLFTSGSTGVPKGVVLEHRNLASTLTHYGRRVGWEVCGGPRMLQFSSFVWDTHTLEVLGTLLWGGCVCMPSEAERADLGSFIYEKAVEWVILTPTVLRTLDAHSPQMATVKTIVSCGERVDLTTVNDWAPSCRFVNEYGPSEVSGRCMLQELTAFSPFPQSIGKPVDCAAWIVSLETPTKLAPIGTIGEILVEGPGVAREYLDDEALTGASFVPRPSWLPPSRESRYYRTGDTAKYNADGSMTFTGRRDGQVKIRGQRFELGEVERALVRVSGVREAVVCIQPRHDDGNILTAVVSLADAQLQDTAKHLQGSAKQAIRQVSLPTGYNLSKRLRSIRDHVSELLPSYMVPTAWLVVQDTMPVVTSGKLDRPSVIAWVQSQDMDAARGALQPSAASALTAPISNDEKTMRSVWASVLNVHERQIGRESNFMVLGGDSIAAMRAAGMCRRRGLVVPLQALMQSLSLAEVVFQCEEVTTSSSTLPPTQPYDIPVVSNFPVEGFAAIGIEAVAEATDAQASMVALGELDRHALVLKTGLIFEPPADVARIKFACAQVLQTHEILRTVFTQKGPRLYQIVLRRPVDSQILPDEGPHSQRNDILPQFYVASDGQHCHRLRLEIHHALYDAVSLGMTWNDIAAAYAGRELSRETSFLDWARRLTQLDHLEAKSFWRATLKGSQLTYLVPPRQTPGTLKQVELRVPLPSLTVPGLTTANLFKAAWALVMGREAGTQDVVFAEVLANRYNPSLSASVNQETVRGPCMNTNPVRAHFEPNMTFVALATQLQEQSLAAASFAYLGYRTIQKDCTDWPLNSLFGSVVNFQSPEVLGDEELDLGDSITARMMPPAASPPSRSAALWTIVRPTDEELVVGFNFSSAAFDEEKVKGFAGQVEDLLKSKPSDISPWISKASHAFRGQASESLSLAASSDEQACVGQEFIDETPEEVRLVVLEVWKAIGLQIKDDHAPIFECGGDTVTALLLSRQYRRQGYDLTIGAVLANSSRQAQANLLFRSGMSQLSG